MTSPISTEETSRKRSSGEYHENIGWFVVGFELIMLVAMFVLTVIAVMTAGVARNVTEIPAVSAWTILTAFAAVTAVLLMLLKSARGTKLFAALFSVAIFLGVGSLIAPLLGVAWAVFGTSLAIVAYYSNPSILVYDIVLLFGLSGVAAVTGPALLPDAVLTLLGVLALYDVVAVYGTKHMVRFANVLLRRKVFFAMIMPHSPKGLRVRLDAVALGGGFVFLGTGDLVLPALLVSSITAHRGLGHAYPVMVGTIIGFIALNAMFTKGRGKPMPALPPIALGAISGYVISLLLQ